MSVTYSTTVKNDRLQAVVDAIDAGSGSGLLNLGTTGMATIVATIVLNKPCATVADGVLTWAGLPLSDIGANGGTPSVAEITDSDGNLIISGLTVGTAGTDIVISTATVVSGDTVSLTSGTITGN